MKLLRTFCLTLILVLSVSIIFAQTKPFKMGHCNAEVLVAYLPEAKLMETELITLNKKLKERLNVKQMFLEQKYKEHMEKVEKKQFTGTQEADSEKEIQKLQSEIQVSSEEAELEVQKKSQELLQPILDKVQKAIDEVAEANGYTYIVNSQAGSTTILIKAPREDDITIRVATKMGVTLPQDVKDALEGKKPAQAPVKP